MLKVAVSIKVKRCDGRYNHWCDVSVHYRLVPISTKVDDLANDSGRKDGRLNGLVCDLLKVNAQIFALLRDQLLAFKGVHVETFGENVPLICCCVLLRNLSILTALRITPEPFVLAT